MEKNRVRDQPLFTFKELSEALGVSNVRPRADDREIYRISTDSRNVEPGDVFWAIRGENFDGHDFLKDAVERGAIGAVVEKGRLPEAMLVKCQNLIMVPDTLQALAEVAGWYRQQLETLAIGITGSVGKTTTKDFLQGVLSSHFPGVSTPLNYNNEIGVPLSMFEVASAHEYAIFEMGARKRGDIAHLAKIVAPEIGILTAVEPVHLATFEVMDRIYETKWELIESLPSTGFAVVNGDDHQLRKMASRASCRVLFVGFGKHNDVTCRKYQCDSSRGLSFETDEGIFHTQLHGKTSVNACLFVIAVAREMGIPQLGIQQAISRLQNPPGRMQLIRVGRWTIIDDTYNASPASMKEAVNYLANWPGHERKIVIAGSMLELGEKTVEYHFQLGQLMARRKIDLLMTCGEAAHNISRGATRTGMSGGCVSVFDNHTRLFEMLPMYLEEPGVILVKGSRGLRMEFVVEFLKTHLEQQFDQLAVVNSRKCA